jgi:hypothetical protein
MLPAPNAQVGRARKTSKTRDVRRKVVEGEKDSIFTYRLVKVIIWVFGVFATFEL